MRNTLSGAAVLALIVPGSGLAQTPPDAGALQQQIERERTAPLPRQALPERPAEPPPMKPAAGASITVSAFRFAGNTLLDAAQLAPAVAGYLRRPLDFAELQQAAAAVATAYREAGWVVRAYLPAQDIVDGIVTIQIVEAVFGGTRHEGAEPTRLKLSYVLEMVEAQQRVGAPLNADAIDRALLLADDLPGVLVSGSVRAGSKERETDLVLRMADEPLVGGTIALDNTGSRSTGADHISASLNLNSPLGFGDLLGATAIHTQGSDYLRLGATVPVGADGWRAGLSASQLRYALIGADFAALQGRGTAATTGLEASYPLLRSRLRNLYFNANIERKRFDNQSGGAVTTHYRADTLSLGLAGNLYDSLGGGGANSASLSFVEGKLNLDDSPNRAADAATLRSAGRYGKLRYALSRQQVLSADWSLFAALAGQMAGKNLDSSEKFYLGGAAGVRAYPASEAGGAEGQMINLELRWRLPDGFSLAAFEDWGQVRINRNNSFAGAPALNDYSLKGGGLALGWQASSGLNLRITWARRQGDNPNPTATGRDQDGTLVRDRLWASLTVPF